MRELFIKWRYYGLGQTEYKKCMGIIFSNNISGLRKANLIAAVLTFFFAIFPIITENDFAKTKIYLISSIAAFIMYFFSAYKKRQFNQKKQISRSLIYILIFLFFMNVMMFGLYLAVWANTEKIAGSFIGILICVLFLFNISPVLYLCLMLSAVITFITTVILYKNPLVWNYDIQNAMFAGIVGLIFGWQIIMNRITMASTAKKLENERDSYYDQSTVDELTQLKNRRDFIQTFCRYNSNYRETDHFLCLAIMDIDFFKNYNDHYGHPMGDECLRKIGKALNDLNAATKIYTARIGGEEFALVWFEEEAAHANNVTSQVIQMIRDLNIPHEKSDAAPYVTVSIGLHITKCGVTDDTQILYDMADKALYTAKRSGRNRAVDSTSLAISA
ncbi:MAG: GGDEF domain-containing protein [Treponema sp.]|jgi:diguanylate cyclase (GGDEF)-like protein|nr:GGDEF domain-containing protein [Treponema sp.]